MEEFKIKFAIFLNDELICVAGQPGEGDLSAQLNYLSLNGQRPECSLLVNGTELHPATNQLQLVCWPSPQVHAGDIVRIEVMNDGEFDEPIRDSDTRKSLFDPDFGELHPTREGWEFDWEFQRPPFEFANVCFYADNVEPTNRQRLLLLEFKRRFELVWPDIRDALRRCHHRINDELLIESEILPKLIIEIPTDSAEIICMFQFTNDDVSKMYSITVRDWEIVGMKSE